MIDLAMVLTPWHIGSFYRHRLMAVRQEQDPARDQLKVVRTLREISSYDQLQPQMLMLLSRRGLSEWGERNSAPGYSERERETMLQKSNASLSTTAIS